VESGLHDLCSLYVHVLSHVSSWLSRLSPPIPLLLLLLLLLVLLLVLLLQVSVGPSACCVVAHT
jgi:hypothetical protein